MPLCAISLLSATVQMYISKRRFTFFHYCMAVLIAVLAAYLADAICTWLDFDEDLSTGIIGVSAYVAPHLLDAINNIAAKLSKEPLKLLVQLLIKVQKGD